MSDPTPRHSSRFSLATTIFLILFALSAEGQTAFVRVNQVGYVAAASKRAYLMALGAETGATFSVKNSSGSTVFGPAAIGASLGSWNNTYPDVYPLDFDSGANYAARLTIDIGDGDTYSHWNVRSPATVKGKTTD